MPYPRVLPSREHKPGREDLLMGSWTYKSVFLGQNIYFLFSQNFHCYTILLVTILFDPWYLHRRLTKTDHLALDLTHKAMWIILLGLYYWFSSYFQPSLLLSCYSICFSTALASTFFFCLRNTQVTDRLKVPTFTQGSPMGIETMRCRMKDGEYYAKCYMPRKGYFPKQRGELFAKRNVSSV